VRPYRRLRPRRIGGIGRFGGLAERWQIAQKLLESAVSGLSSKTRKSCLETMTVMLR
jgi:hypothetical protein